MPNRRFFREAGRRDGDSDFLVASPQKIKDLFGWQPKYQDLKLMVETAFNWEKKLQKVDT